MIFFHGKTHPVSRICKIFPQNQHHCLQHPLCHEDGKMPSLLHLYWQIQLTCSCYLCFSQPALLSAQTSWRIFNITKQAPFSNNGARKIEIQGSFDNSENSVDILKIMWISANISVNCHTLTECSLTVSIKTRLMPSVCQIIPHKIIPVFSEFKGASNECLACIYQFLHLQSIRASSLFLSWQTA